MKTTRVDLSAAEIRVALAFIGEPIGPTASPLVAKLGDALVRLERVDLPADPWADKTITETVNGGRRGYTVEPTREERGEGAITDVLRFVLWEGFGDNILIIRDIFEVELAYVERRLRPRAPLRFPFRPDEEYDPNVVRAAIARRAALLAEEAA